MADLKQIARQIFQHTLAAIDIPRLMQAKLQLEGSRLSCIDPEHSIDISPHVSVSRAVGSVQGNAAPRTSKTAQDIDLRDFDKIRVIAFGKAAHGMAEGLTSVLEPEFHVSGIVSAPTSPQNAISGFTYFVAGHPLPTAISFEAGRAILDLLHECNVRTLVFFLISGGGSALVECPLDPQLSLEDVQTLNRALVQCGASIDEINTVRKHLSAVKGGRLATAAPLAMKVTYGVTDVPPGKESALASGPTIPDPTTLRDVERVLSDFALRAALPKRVENFLLHGAAKETPKSGEPAFARAQFQIIAGMHDLFHAAHRTSEAAGFFTICDNTTDDWPVTRASDYLLDQLSHWQRGNRGRPVAVIADGEVSSPVMGNGVGGRNCAFVLDCVRKIVGKKIAVLSAGTDGVDGASPAAGAVADGETDLRAKENGLDPIEFYRRSDSYAFFEGLEDTIVTGPTGNNLRDLRILLSSEF